MATFAIGEAGAVNAALFAAAMLSLQSAEIREKLSAWRMQQSETVRQTSID